jgi:hypothetical protein
MSSRVRPVTTGSTNRKQVEEQQQKKASERAEDLSNRTNSINLTRSTGSFSLTKKRDGRPVRVFPLSPPPPLLSLSLD